MEDIKPTLMMKMAADEQQEGRELSAPSSLANQSSASRGANLTSGKRQETTDMSVSTLLATGASVAASQTSKQQSAARVRSITGKLLDARGAELRRTLFALRQTFQDDGQLAQEFAESPDGFSSLLKVARDADQIEQNYILRAVGQLIGQPAGMDCLARHNETLQWLYKLLGSQHRLVARTALKLLLQFLGHKQHGERHAIQLCAAIKQVDTGTGSRYWSHLVGLFKPQISGYSNNAHQNQQPHQVQDVGLLVDSMRLVNKTLDQIPQDEEDTYFDFIDALEQLGMESIIKKYSNLDAQLREQFKLYEQKLATEGDGDNEEDEDEEEEGEEEEEEAAGEGKDQRERVRDLAHDIGKQAANMESQYKTRREQANRVTFSDHVERRHGSGMCDSAQDDCNTSELDDGKRELLKNRQATPATSRTISETSSGPPLASLSDESDANQTTGDDDNNYESANDDSNGNLPSIPRQVSLGNAGAASSTASSQILVNNKLVQTVNENHQEASQTNGAGQRHRHQLQLRSQQPTATAAAAAAAATQCRHANGTGVAMRQEPASKSKLARGKQQRASISSCSSSDSYASYGSGYASGSGNSTDHELKQRCQPPACLSSSSASAKEATGSGDHTHSSNLDTLTTGIINLGISANSQRRPGASKVGSARHAAGELKLEARVGLRTRADADDADEEAEAEAEEEEDDDDSQLKQHLSELEQLTDELAKRGDVYSDRASSAGRQNYSPARNSAGSSTTSSVLSTASNKSASGGSNISSLSLGLSSSSPFARGGGGGNNIVSGSLGTKESASGSLSVADSRSTSATPTSLEPASQVCAPGGQVVSSYSARQQHQLPADNSIETNQVTTGALTSSNNNKIMSNISGSGSSINNNNNNNNGLTSASSGSSSLSSSRNHLRVAPGSTMATKAQPPQEAYYHNLFQWEQLVSKGVTRPLLINDLDFTDLRDEDDCDLLNTSSSPSKRLQAGQPLTISIPSAQQVQAALDHDSVDSGASTGSPGSRSAANEAGGGVSGTLPASAPPPLPPPPISPWFNTISGSRPQSQLMSSPSPPPFDGGARDYNRDQSPAASSTYSSYSRNSVCGVSQAAAPLSQQFGSLRPVGSLRSASSMSSLLFGNNGKGANKRKKTMKLFWKEVREDRSLLARLTKKKTIWDEIKPVQVDTAKLEYLFESKAKDLSLSKSRNGLDGQSQRKLKITVLDAKRSNAINIGMTKLPPMRTIKSAILKMDSSIMNREGIEKILTTMMPSEEEKSRIIEAQLANPDTPLGTAEQFLLNLASISALEARLKLWAFQLDYAQIEKEVAEPLMDLKQAIDEIERSETFRNILGTLLSIGNFLNSTNAKGFQIDYLEKVPEVKDTVHKHSLLHHLCLFIQEKFDPELASDLYSEFSAVNRASKVDYTEVAKSLKKMQQDCKASWDHLKIVAKHDGLANLMNTCGGGGGGGGGSASSSSSSSLNESSPIGQQIQKPAGKLNNLSKLSMITTVIGSESSGVAGVGASGDSQQTAGATTTKQLKMKVSDFLTDCAERIMVLMVIHRRVMNRFQKLLVYLGCPLHQIKQTQPQNILKIINEFALEYRTKRERVREMLLRKQQSEHHHHHHNHHHHHHGQHHNHLHHHHPQHHYQAANRWHLNRMRWAGSSQCIDSFGYSGRPNSTASSCASSSSSSYAMGSNCATCCALGGSPRNLANGIASHHRPGSPSGLSQISNYSDFLADQPGCCSRQDSITPVPSLNGANGRRSHSMSVSMLDLQNQQQQAGSRSANNSFNSSCDEYAAGSSAHNSSLDENQLARQKDEQLRRLLGAGKSLDEACHDLYQMSHWTSTMARVSRPAPHKQRASSLAPWSHRNLDL